MTRALRTLNACIAALLVLSSAIAQAPPRIARARVELTGPLRTLRLRARSSTTTVDTSLAAGERRAAGVLVADFGEGEPALESDGGGSARFAGWDADFSARCEAWWSALPIGLRTRPAAYFGELGASDRRPPPIALLLACAALPMAWTLRRRAAWCAASAALFSIGVAAAVARTTPAREVVRVLEGDGDNRWLAADSARDELRIDGELAQRLELDPERAAVEVHGELRNASAFLAAPGARIRRTLAVEAGERSWTRERNAWGELAECWLREPSGEWSAHGTWPVGRPLPAAAPELPRDPPGWLNPALPQGASILIGRLAPGAFAGADAPPGATWVRIVGLADH